MTITFCIEAHDEREDEALATEHAPTLNLHNTGGWTLLTALGIEPDHYGQIDATDLVARIDATSGTIPTGDEYVPQRLAWLRDVAAAANRLGRQVVWG